MFFLKISRTIFERGRFYFSISICLAIATLFAFLTTHNSAVTEGYDAGSQRASVSENQVSVPYRSNSVVAEKPFRNCPDTFSRFKTEVQSAKAFDAPAIKVTRDKAHVYKNIEILPSADPMTFELLDMQSAGAGGDAFVGRDKNHVFFGPDFEVVEPYKQHAGHIVTGGDPLTFRVIWDIETTYPRDAAHLFNWQGIISNADLTTIGVYL